MSDDLLQDMWQLGYSIAELWGFTAPVTRGTSEISEPHCLMWGILGIVEYQVNKGAGHRYLRDRIAYGDWVGIGFAEPDRPDRQLSIIPKMQNAKFGRKQSAVGDGVTTFTNVRFVHQKLYADERP